MLNSVIPRVRIWEGLDGLCAGVPRPSSGFFGACNPIRNFAITIGWPSRQQEPTAADRGPRSFVDFAVDDMDGGEGRAVAGKKPAAALDGPQGGRKFDGLAFAGSAGPRRHASRVDRYLNRFSDISSKRRRTLVRVDKLVDEMVDKTSSRRNERYPRM